METKKYPLIDTHVHIDELTDLEGAIRRAQSVGIGAIIGVGSDLASNEKVLQIAQTFPGYLFPALGFHPWQIKAHQVEVTLDAMEREVDRNEVYVADECFLTGTAAHITPVVEIDRRQISDGEIGRITGKLQEIYSEVIRGSNPKYLEWCTAVYKTPIKGTR